MISMACEVCGQRIKKLVTDARTTCVDRAKCQGRAKEAGPPPTVLQAPAPGEVVPTDPDKIIQFIKDNQQTLAIKSLEVTVAGVELMGEIIRDKGYWKEQESVDAHGNKTVVRELTPLPPMALAAIVRELRPVVQEPIRAREEAQTKPPVTIQTDNPAVIREVVKILRENREKARLAEAAPIVLEGET